MAKKAMVEKNKKKTGAQHRNRCNLCGRPRGYIRFLVYVGFVSEI